mgnify:CR=1 FL=1
MFFSKNYNKHLYKVISLIKGISLSAVVSILFFGLPAAQAAVPEDLYSKEAPKKVLSLAGGGARGYIELIWLSELEKKNSATNLSII